MRSPFPSNSASRSLRLVVPFAFLSVLRVGAALAEEEEPRGAVENLGVIAQPTRSESLQNWAIAAQTGASLSLLSVDFALDAARRWRRFGVLAKVDWNRWVNTQKPPLLTRGTLNLGVGGEFLYFEGRARTAVVAGPSILLFRTVLDRPGKTGVFVDIYPSSLYWRLARPLYVRFDPLSFHVIAPVLDSIPLVVFEYRTSIALEWRI